MNQGIDALRNAVRSFIHKLAVALNTVSKGKITPTMVTMTGFVAHLPIAYLIAISQYVPAAGLLVIFGLFDALDGSLARLQGRASNAGMVLDASTDRMKEVILYIGVVYGLLNSVNDDTAARAGATVVAACGASLLVSYVKAKGETAVKDSNLSANEINRLFQDGFLRFEIRMFILIAGLLSGLLLEAVTIIAILAWITAFDRLIKITRKV